MANADMWTYLSVIPPDYTGTLSVAPSDILPFTSSKAQDLYKMDSGAIKVITKSDQSYFDLALQWDKISRSDHGIIFDFYNHTSKANGMENTFYWEHPIDGYTYVARFIEPLKSSWVYSYTSGYLKVDPVKLRVEGKKAV